MDFLAYRSDQRLLQAPYEREMAMEETRSDFRRKDGEMVGTRSTGRRHDQDSHDVAHRLCPRRGTPLQESYS
jgi:hypothetical protein